MCHNTRGLRRGCLVSFGNRRALIWITQICHSALFCISPERFSSSSPLLSSLALSVCLFLPYSCGPYHAWGDVHKVSSQNIKLNLQLPFKSYFKSFQVFPCPSSPPSLPCHYWKKTCWDMNPFYGRLSSLLLKRAPSGRPSHLARVGNVVCAAEYSLAFCLSLLAVLSLIMKSRGERLAVIHLH